MELVRDPEKETSDELEGGDLAAYKDIDLKNYVRHFEYLAIRQGLWSKVNCELRHRFDEDYQAYLKYNSPMKRCTDNKQTVPKNMVDKSGVEKRLGTIYNNQTDVKNQLQDSTREVAVVIEKWQSESNEDVISETAVENGCSRVKLIVYEICDSDCKASYGCECCGKKLASFGSAMEHIGLNKSLPFLREELGDAAQGSNNVILVEIENEPSPVFARELLVRKENIRGSIEEDSLPEDSQKDLHQDLLVDFADGSDISNCDKSEQNETDDQMHRSSSETNKLGSKAANDTYDEDEITYEMGFTLPLTPKPSKDKIQLDFEDNIKVKYASKSHRLKKKVLRIIKECVAYTFVIFF